MSLWEFENKAAMLGLLIGKSYGEDPHLQLGKIQEVKAKTARIIYRSLKLDASSVVVDLGSGTGWISRTIAQRVRHLHCCDISNSFLEVAREECAAQTNVSYHLIEPRKLTWAEPNSVDAIYSNNVFIHMNLYDVSLYFKEFARILKPKGKVWLDFVSDRSFTHGIPPVFSEMESLYLKEPAGLSRLVQYYSKDALAGIAKGAGLKLTGFQKRGQTVCLATFTKRKPRTWLIF